MYCINIIYFFYGVQHGSNMTDDLIDPEGYPRADVDVLTVRKTRVRVICKFMFFYFQV